MVPTAALTSLGTTSPRYIKQQAMYFRGVGHTWPSWKQARSTVCDLSNRELLVEGFLSRDDWSVGGKHEVDSGYGTKLVWNSVTSTLKAPSNLREAVKEEIT
ncbi:hypothetical protein Bca52824_096780 [Brassica carinata]|nr:hypothetical protein Bca52824_096780 [Brassica carinata]